MKKFRDILIPPLGWGISNALGLLIWTCTNRREIALRNLALSFPERSEKWRRKIAFRSVMRMVEMFIVPLINPLLSDEEVLRRHKIPQQELERISAVSKNGRVIFQPPHCCMSEAGVFLPLMIPSLHMSTLYRALDWKPAERYVRWARSRWGFNLISRKNGLLEVRRRLGKGDNMLILFDQNAGKPGALILNFGRICSATDLPGSLAAHFGTQLQIILCRRKGFLRSTMEMHTVPNDGSVEDMTARTTIVFERLLADDDELCADWMWSHRRWKSLMTGADNCLNYRTKKNYLDKSLQALGLEKLPRRLPYVLRVPASRAKAEALAARMEDLRKRREDVRWVLVCPSQNASLFPEGVVCERLIAFNAGGLKKALKEAANEWTETYLSVEPDGNLLQEGRLCRAQYCAGMCVEKKDEKRGRKCTCVALPDCEKEAAFKETLEAFFRACGYENVD